MRLDSDVFRHLKKTWTRLHQMGLSKISSTLKSKRKGAAARLLCVTGFHYAYTASVKEPTAPSAGRRIDVFSTLVWLHTLYVQFLAAKNLLKMVMLLETDAWIFTHISFHRNFSWLYCTWWIDDHISAKRESQIDWTLWKCGFLKQK